MSALLMIQCPHCKKQFKGPVELEGKRVRCKACGQIFTVKGTAPLEAVRSAPGKPAAKAAAPQQEQMYKLTEAIKGVPRCPQCAAEMESEDAIICLECGYNQMTGQRMNVVKTYHTTAVDLMSWRFPGVFFAVVALLMVGLIGFLWLGLNRYDDQGKESGWVFPAQIWGSVFASFIGWASGRFAVRRLITNPRPPEQLKF
jgi:DNA-directed RNA polymerase subunit RPC12/RpoP